MEKKAKKAKKLPTLPNAKKGTAKTKESAPTSTYVENDQRKQDKKHPYCGKRVLFPYKIYQRQILNGKDMFTLIEENTVEAKGFVVAVAMNLAEIKLSFPSDSIAIVPLDILVFDNSPVEEEIFDF